MNFHSKFTENNKKAKSGRSAEILNKIKCGNRLLVLSKNRNKKCFIPVPCFALGEYFRQFAVCQNKQRKKAKNY